MRHFVKLFSILVAASLFVVLPLQAQKGGGQAKVDIIHNGHLITVAEPAVAAHLAHGDTYPGPTAFTVNLTVKNVNGGETLATSSQAVTAGGEWLFSVVLSGNWSLISFGYTGAATVGDPIVVGNLVTVAVSTVNSAVDILIYVDPVLE